MIPTTAERRFCRAEIRADGEGKKFVGRAVVYKSDSRLLYGRFTEEIQPGAFAKSLASERDVYCTIDHDPTKLLGRMSAGTLQLIPDANGIRVEVPYADYSYARDLEIAINRRDLAGMSFIFNVLDDDWTTKDGHRHRIVKQADLHEVSFVFDPAYPATEADFRSANALRRMFEIFDQPQLDLMRRKMQLATLL